MHRSHLVSVALSLRASRVAPPDRAGLRARPASGPTPGRAPRTLARSAAARTPFQLSVNPSLLSLTASAGCVI
jgi:hypothetical protein